MQHLFLIRHCPTAVEKGRLVGSTDVPVAEGFESRIAILADLLPRACTCYCSPLLRTRQTHKMLCEYGWNREAVIDERIREIDFGRWEMKNFDEISRNEPHMIEGWLAYQSFAFPEGESVAGFTARITSWLDEVRHHNDNNIVLVTHGGVIRHLICHALQIPLQNYLLFDVQPASLTTINLFPEGGVLTGFNK